ncbi:MAG TPA: RidA family protein [Chloroflexota bacterium]|jgi:2-iminobutanoate/2-iminopropanoate deaminase|nr:RidA family protein [Chloroflexota bacterium]
MPKEIVRTDTAPTPIGPYSQGVRAGNLFFVAGQGCMNPATGQMARESVESETRQVLENVKAILGAAGLSLGQVVKTTCYLADMNDFQAFNAVYATYFAEQPPARTTIQAARLPGDIKVEVEAIALIDD